MIGRGDKQRQYARTNRNQSSPTKAATQLQADSSEYITNLKAKRDNYSTQLQIYQNFYQKGLPQKCVKHLDYVTLYCEDEHKLLCVNCVFGNTIHQKHAVGPMKQAMPRIRQDNIESAQLLQNQIQDIKQTQARIHQNKRILENQSQIILRDIDAEFNQIYKMIQNKHKQVREKAIAEFQKAEQENLTSNDQISWWRQEMQNIKGRLPKDNKGYSDNDPQRQAAQIYKHLVFKLMLSQKLQTQKLIYIASKQQMEDEFLNEVRQLKQTIKYKVQDPSEQNKTSTRQRPYF